MPTYVKLNRILGNSDKRDLDPTLWQMIVPIKNPNGTFSAPKDLTGNHLKHPAIYSQFLEEGKTVLVNRNGGYNFLTKTDHIFEMWTELK